MLVQKIEGKKEEPVRRIPVYHSDKEGESLLGKCSAYGIEPGFLFLHCRRFGYVVSTQGTILIAFWLLLVKRNVAFPD